MLDFGDRKCDRIRLNARLSSSKLLNSDIQFSESQKERDFPQRKEKVEIKNLHRNISGGARGRIKSLSVGLHDTTTEVNLM